MKRILVPVDDTALALRAVRHAAGRFLSEPDIELHLLNVQAAFPRDVARFTSSRSRRDLQREQAEAALAPARRHLDERSIPYGVHWGVGDRAKTIAATARRLRCHQIVMCTGRKTALARLLEGSVSAQVIELSPVPVEVVPAGEVTNLERYGLPAMLAAALAAALAIVD